MDPFDNSASLAFVERLYADYLDDPATVPPDWRDYFAHQPTPDGQRMRATPSFRPRGFFERNGRRRRAETDGRQRAAGAKRPPDERKDRSRQKQQAVHEADEGDGGGAVALLQHRVDQLIRNYRVRGHMVAQLDPLGLMRDEPPELSPQSCGLTDADLDRPFATDSIPGPPRRTLRDIVDHLRNTYCRSIGAQFMHIDDLAVRQWLQQRMESTANRIDLPRKRQRSILRWLTDAVGWEQFVQKKYLGAKSFSLEGAETLIPLLDMAIDKGAEQGLDEVVLAMAHRGRLNVLVNIMEKPAAEVLREFEDRDPKRYRGGGDVKYHLGYSNDRTCENGRDVHLSLCFNPSHLEFINPVALGRVRAKQDRAGDTERRRCLSLTIHGDAGIAGEGIAAEALNLSQLEDYTVGGTLHVVVNNQIGFTTPPGEARSSTYCTDIARSLQSPVFHVNGEDPEAVMQVVNLAMDFRAEFQRDVFIDMFCYRKLGHNEIDDPSFTNPAMYETIQERQPLRDAYLDRLLNLDGITRQQADELAEQCDQKLEQALERARSSRFRYERRPRAGVWADYQGGSEHDVDEPPTGVGKKRLAALLNDLTTLPEDFEPHKKITQGFENRRKMAAGEKPLDWSAGEALALASLATEGWRVRLSGQDTQRGTFSQRHAVIHDMNDGSTHTPLQHLSDEQAPVEVINSPLCEAGALGFEYGYSLDSPDALVAWEAQFGDFANAAQVIIDQFIASAEDKWNRLSGLVLLLPHGWEGQGPEHASARLERWLMLAAEENIQVTQPTTPAQYFHLLRRQVLRSLRKPLVVLTPKSLLRHAKVVSSIDELADGSFERVLRDREFEQQDEIERVLLCSGKIYFELLEQREELGRDDVAIVRVEQLYPFPDQPLRAALAPFADGTPAYWVQEEPLNMGAWPYLAMKMDEVLFDRLPLEVISRPESASPATGSAAAHKLEQRALIDRAFGGD